MDSMGTINSLEDAINLVRWGSTALEDLNVGIADYKGVFPRGTWFRGQENSSWQLIPSVFRENKRGERDYAHVEPRMVREFKMENASQAAKMADNLDWLALMQHHRCPTRILAGC